jgi:hypothetical protein
MRRRRWILLSLVAVKLLITFRLMFLIAATGKILGYDAAFDAWRGAVERQTVEVSGISADIYTGRRSRSPVLFVHGVNVTG